MKRNTISMDIEMRAPLDMEGAFDNRKTYTSPTVVHQRVESEHGFLSGSKPVTATTVQEQWIEKDINAEFDWDAQP